MGLSCLSTAASQPSEIAPKFAARARLTGPWRSPQSSFLRGPAGSELPVARLSRRSRMNNSKSSELIRFARADAGSTVIDVWPGSGDWTRLFSDIVGPEGRAYSETGSCKAQGGQHGGANNAKDYEIVLSPAYPGTARSDPRLRCPDPPSPGHRRPQCPGNAGALELTVTRAGFRVHVDVDFHFPRHFLHRMSVLCRTHTREEWDALDPFEDRHPGFHHAGHYWLR